MLFICHPTCTTCKKAQAFLEKKGKVFTWRDIREDNPTIEELGEWLVKSGLPVKRFFNTSGMQYRALGLTQKLPQMAQEEQLALLATDGMLVKRPLLIDGERVLVGFRQKEWEEALG